MNEFPLPDITELGRRYDRWNGKIKFRTRNCDGCEWYRLMPDERCYWGVAWKRLMDNNQQRKCQYYDKTSPRQEKFDKLVRSKEESKILKENPLKVPERKGYYDVTFGRWEKF